MATNAYIVEPVGSHTHSLILLHGLGSTGDKFGRELIENGISSDGKSLPQLLPGARFIFPTSKRRRSTAFDRSVLTQWFDIASLDDPSFRNYTQFKGMEESSREIFHLINQERENVPDKNIILGGISQGCAMGFMCLLAMDFPIGGYIDMSSWLPFADDFECMISASHDICLSGEEDNPFAVSNEESDPENLSAKAHIYAKELLGLETDHTLELEPPSTPVFIGHGEEDEKVKFGLGEEARRIFSSIGYDVNWKCYAELGHWYNVPGEIDDILDFIRNNVGWSL
ncbi:acyl- thioesterase [Fusarium longipes]|uniref:Acyl-thioesterase n=1 Tax=Fusarium longipes TaxID=694270 RepID=A0A395SW77_9HYPO|nr:acyl- thioesterase [Fusarium longipes]